MPLPDALRNYIETSIIGTREPAFLFMDAEGKLVEWGGPLARYGAGDLRTGQSAALQIPFLEGLLPADKSPIMLPAVEVVPGTFADVHILSGDGGDWILLLDATQVAHELQKLQQKINEHNLNNDNAVEEGDGDQAAPWESVFPTLNMAVMRRVAVGVFDLVSVPPSWLIKLWPQSVSKRDSVRPGEVFPFLEYFLSEAEAFWESATSGQIASGFWSETDVGGNEYQLEATAAFVDDTRLLLISYPEHLFKEQQSLLQKSRDISLIHQRTLQEIEKKDVLLHCIVHDLKGPLSTMKGVLDLLAAGTLKPEERESMIASGQMQAERQLGMINDILSAYSAEMGDVDPALVRRQDAPDAVQCARTVAESLSPAFLQKQVTVTVDIEPTDDGSWPVVGDASRLERIFTNLLENALRHVDRGKSVKVGFSRSEGFITAKIDDQGPGVPVELLDTLFDKFSQGKNGGSTGLGLYFCRITVERWGGSISAKNLEGGGARFWFRLPEPTDHA